MRTLPERGDIIRLYLDNHNQSEAADCESTFTGIQCQKTLANAGIVRQPNSRCWVVPDQLTRGVPVLKLYSAMRFHSGGGGLFETTLPSF